ncbi:MAG: hypothetical protein KJS68_05200 [Alphaproteobacteria bacterium]|nr:hypothetical protein [Alphaproteobacteria bacterium]
MALIGALAVTSPAVSHELRLPLSGKITTYATSNENGGHLPTIARGQQLGVACAEIGEAGAVVQVVLQITHALGETATGYDAVLATDQKITDDEVHVRVPAVPGLSQHIVNVKVFVTDSKGTHSCDGGRVRIV